MVLGGIDNHVAPQASDSLGLEQVVVDDALFNGAVLLAELLQEAKHVFLAGHIDKVCGQLKDSSPLPL
jgi:hypothetical protein